MNYAAETLAEEMGCFTDVGAGRPNFYETSDEIRIGIVRNGQRVSLHFNRHTRKIIERTESEAISHLNYRSLLASFSQLRNWAGSQYQLLNRSINEDKLIEVEGAFVEGSNTYLKAGSGQIGRFLENVDCPAPDAVKVLLIDGPAGIGKTRLIELLSYRRARDFIKTQAPLILHVKSRGRVLTYLQDLMAFSLQTIRASVTYDQIPILVRHGLVQLAIDGFDELGDPNGYENAWAQLGELIHQIRGGGAIVLAGRETFIGKDRLLKAIPSLKNPQSTIGVLSLQPVDPATAKRWLGGRGWTDAQFADAEDWGLFEHGSYALRPFFLAQLSELGSGGKDFASVPPLTLLVNDMIKRESDKFGDRVDALLNEKQRREFVFEVLSETARDIAENQSDSIDEEGLIWIVEAVLGDGFDSEVARLLKNRVLAIAFLEEDDRRGRRRFAHSEFYNYFLSHAVIRAIIRPEIPKFVRRTIFGADFLLTFGVVLSAQKADITSKFLASARELLNETSNLDRGGRNIGALLLAGLPVAEFPDGFAVNNVDVDDSVIRGKAQKSYLRGGSINQLDLREADVSNVSFDKILIGTLICDPTTRLSSSFPNVGWVELSGDGKETTLLGEDAESWLNAHGRASKRAQADLMIPDSLRKHGLFELVQRICRVMLRQHWIRSEGDDRATDLVRDVHWEELVELLKRHNLVSITDSKPVGGRTSTFYHVKHAREILAEDTHLADVDSFFADLKVTAK